MRKSKVVSSSLHSVLSPSQVESIYYFVEDYITDRHVEMERLSDYFAAGTDSFVDFMLSVELAFKWFDYTQSINVLEILDLYIIRVNADINC